MPKPIIDKLRFDGEWMRCKVNDDNIGSMPKNAGVIARIIQEVVLPVKCVLSLGAELRGSSTFCTFERVSHKSNKMKIDFDFDFKSALGKSDYEIISFYKRKIEEGLAGAVRQIAEEKIRKRNKITRSRDLVEKSIIALENSDKGRKDIFNELFPRRV